MVMVVWKDQIREVEEIKEVIKDFFPVVPIVTRVRRHKKVEILYNRYSDGLLEDVEESLMITPATKLLRSWNEYDKSIRMNGEVYEYRTKRWAVILYKWENREVMEARVTLHGRVPTEVKRLVKQAVEEIRQEVQQ